MRLAVLAQPLLFLLVLSACTGPEKVTSSGPFQKRKYQKGWHVQLSDGGDKGGPSGPSVELEEQKWADGDEEELSELPTVPDKNSGECDIIVKTDGERVKAKVRRIGTEKIEYKKCGREDGPTYEVLRSDVKLIRYPDGEEDRFEESEDEEEGERSEEQESEEDDYYVTPEERDEQEEKEEERTARDGEEQGNDTIGILGFVLSVISALVTLIGLFSIPVTIFLVGLGASLISLLLCINGNGGLSTAGTIISLINLGIGLLLLMIAVLLVI